MSAIQAMTPSDWHTLNYDGLLAEIETVKLRLQQRPTPSEASNTSVMLDRLCQVFGLSRFERQLLLLCAASELDAEVAGLYQAAVQQPLPNLALALSLFDGDCGVMAPDAPLRYFQLVAFDTEGASLMRGGLCLSEWSLMYLLGKPILDPWVSASLRPVERCGPPLASLQRMADQVNRARRVPADEVVAIQMVADSAEEARQVAALMAESAEQPVYEFNLYQLPVRMDEQQSFLPLMERELIAQQGLLLIHGERLQSQGDSPFEHQQLLHWLERFHRDLPRACVLTAQEPLALPSVPVQHLSVPAMTDDERLTLWQHHLDLPDDNTLRDTLQHLNHQYRFTPRQVRTVARSAMAAPVAHEELPQKLWQCSREQSRQDLEGLAQVITPKKLGWEDLVLPAKEKDTLTSIVAQAQSRHQVYQQWGFAEKMEYGFGICALFAGASGTGKTFAARTVASSLGLDLYHVELSSVVDKYIGETEKKLDRIFTAAEKSGAVLLFDEADALFGKRTRVQDSKDRYANLSVSYLLQRMEQFDGLSILTTNARNALDTAFTRRIRFIVNFPFPAEAEREQIWRRSMPDKAPTGPIDYAKLARLSLAGGTISSITLQAAFIAAQAGQPITMELLREAVKLETIKAEKALDQTLVADW